ncbi:MAG: HNH endonuclease [Melioribacteraceae bacterium]|nr:HNH endonuclease [Melioribacteraceae bacterium]
MKYTKEMLEEAIKNNVSFAGVLKSFGLHPSGGSHRLIKSKALSFGISTEHFLGKASNCGSRYKGGLEKISFSDVLVYDRRNGMRESASKLKRSMLESGIEYKCEKCNNDGVWMDGFVSLEVHHKNGDTFDNTKENLVFICPNCHSQTDNFRGRNKVEKDIQQIRTEEEVVAALLKSKNIRQSLIELNLAPYGGNYDRIKRVMIKKDIEFNKKEKKTATCPSCGNKKDYSSAECRKCASIKRGLAERKVERPSKEGLEKMIAELPMTKIGKMFGVSDNTIRKWCKNYGIELGNRLGYWTKIKYSK